MFYKFNLLAVILAFLLYGYAQSQSWDLFDNVGNAGSSGGSSGGSRIYHK